MEPAMQAVIAGAAKPARKIIPIVPYAVKGKYRNLKTGILLLAYTVYFGLPWLTWHGAARSGQPLLFDLANSRFFLFDIVIFPQDLMVLMAIMVMAATMLFVSAALYGRVFCGFFCFQTLWTDAFRMIEGWVQGEAQARIRLMKQPWGLEKIAKLGLTHALWLVLALATAVTFTLYFADARQLISAIWEGRAPMAAYTAIATITATTYVAAGFARENICRVACPYGKFQSAMQDPLTKTVVYDAARGERTQGRQPPAKALKEPGSRQQQGVGDCIDCGYCVNVCPTGVDIRKGFQIDCIACGLCIDACNTIMKSIQLPTGLIDFRQAAAVEPAAKSATISFASRLKQYGYLGLMALAIVFFAYKIQHLEPFVANIQQDQPLVTRMSNGDLKSRYIVRLTNKEAQAQTYVLTLQGLPPDASPARHVMHVPSGKTYASTFSIVVSPQVAQTLQGFTAVITPMEAHERAEPEQAQEFSLAYSSGQAR
jgi:cytochrome c oxidase accessory protein FixG